MTPSRLWLYAKGRQLPLVALLSADCVVAAAVLQSETLIAAGSLSSPTRDLDRSDTGVLHRACLRHAAALGFLGAAAALLAGTLLCPPARRSCRPARLFWYGLALLGSALLGGQWSWTLPALSVIALLAAGTDPRLQSWSWIDAPIPAVPALLLTLTALVVAAAALPLDPRHKR